MASATKSKASKGTLGSKSKRTTGEWDVKVAGLVVDTLAVEFNAKGGPETSEYRFLIVSDDDETGTDDRDEIRAIVADRIRTVRQDEIECQRDRDNDQLDEAIEAIKDANKARKALQVLRAAGLID